MTGSSSSTDNSSNLTVIAAVGFSCLMLVCCAVCLAMWIKTPPSHQIEVIDTRDLQRREYLADTEMDDGQVEWQCLVCVHLNHPDNSSCVLCGAPAEVSMINSIRNPSMANPSFLNATMLSNTTLLRLDSDVADITASSRQRALRYRRLNQMQLNQRQRGAHRRHLWQRVRMPHGQFVWVRMGSDPNPSFLAKLRRNSTILSSSNSLTSSMHEHLHRKNAASMGFVTEVNDTGMMSWKKADSFVIKIEEDDDLAILGDVEIDFEGVISMTFREKKRWFLRKLSSAAVHFTESMHKLVIRRSNLFEDSVTSMSMPDVEERAREHLNITFYGEPALDAGGVLREWFSLVCKELFSAERGLFRSTHAESMGYWINPHSAQAVEDHLKYFKFAGRLFGKAMLDNLCFDAHLALPLLKHWLGVPISFSDLEFLDEEIYKSSCWIRDNDGVDALCLTFCVTTELGETVDLKPNGRDVDVTDENKSEYLMLLLRYYMLDSVVDQLQALLSGLYEIVPRSMLSVFDYQELDFFLCGLPTINVKDWRRNTRVRHYEKGVVAVIDTASNSLAEDEEDEQVDQDSQVVGWFWEVVEAFSDEERARLLQFATGSSRVPVEGFKALMSASGYIHPFTLKLVERGVPPAGLCPRAHTCFNRIDLPLYESREELENYLSLVIQMEITGFGLE